MEAVIRESALEIRGNLASSHGDVLTAEALSAIAVLAPLDKDRRGLMRERIVRRTERSHRQQPIQFLEPDSLIPRTGIRVQDARDGRFTGGEIPADLERQWIQGTGPGTRPHAPPETGIRNVAYALLSGADGWMFDGEDALGQIGSMSLDNQRNLKLAISRDRAFLEAAEQVAGEMNRWSRGFLGREIVEDWVAQLDFTTRIFRPRGLHLDDRHLRDRSGGGFSASLVDLVLYVVNNYRALANEGRSIVLYLPKIQTAEEAALWNDMLSALEDHLALDVGAIKTYVLVEQLEATFQLMEIRAALGLHFVGFNTGRWDYINSVSDARAWDGEFVNPNIDGITMEYGYMRAYEDRVRRAVNTADLRGGFALWQGGMEPNIPVGSPEGVAASMERAIAGARREQRAGASGKWVAHWKMVHLVRPVWEEVGNDNQLGREFPRLTYTGEDGERLVELEGGARTIRGARDLVSVALQYGNAFAQGFQAAALKPSDFFGNDDVLYLMEDMATGEIRLSILWEWLHKSGTLTEDDAEMGLTAGDRFSSDLFRRLLAEEFEKLLRADDRDVHEISKDTTLPIVRNIVEAYVTSAIKPPWFVDLLNLNLELHSRSKSEERLMRYLDAFQRDGIRITENLDFHTASDGRS